MEERKRGRRKIWIFIGIFIVIILVFISYFYFFNNNNNVKGETTILTNPVLGLSDEQAIAQFNESFILYLLVTIGVQNLHNLPFSSDPPKIEVYLGDIVFSSVIVKGSVSIERGKITSPDIKIITSKIEAIKMLRDRSYISRSFENGNSKIELIARKATLFGKGYLEIYNKVTGKNTK